jgi:hypothetical protein
MARPAALEFIAFPAFAEAKINQRRARVRADSEAVKPAER